MQVEMSLAELLINAIAAGKIPGVQFKRGWSDERATFAGFNAVIADRLNGARSVAIQDALSKLQDEHPHFRLRATHARLVEYVRIAADAPQGAETMLPLAAQALLSELMIPRSAPKEGP